MIGASVQGNSLSLRHQVSDLEKQLMQRRSRVRARVVRANRNVAAGLTSPGMLLAAVGVGVAVEQARHHRGWSLATVIEAANACAGLLLALTTFGQKAAATAQRRDP